MNKHKRNYYIVIFMIAAAIIATMSFHFNSKATTETADAEYKYANEGIPVLMYHSIGKKNLNPMIIPTDKFSEQMKFLKENDYTTLTLDEVYNFFAGNIKVPKNQLLLLLMMGMWIIILMHILFLKSTSLMLQYF